MAVSNVYRVGLQYPSHHSQGPGISARLHTRLLVEQVSTEFWAPQVLDAVDGEP